MVLIGMDDDENESKLGTSPLDEVEVEEISFGFERDRDVWDGSMEMFEVEEFDAEFDIDAEEIAEELEESRKDNFTGPRGGEKIKEHLTNISGVGPTTAKALKDAGYESVEDVKKATQSDLAEIGAIGNALAARIKADVGEIKKCEPVDDSSEFLNEGTLMVNME